MKRALLPIFLIVVVDVLGMTIILPFLPFYSERFGATPRTVGFLVASFAACQLVSGPLLGRLSDRIGRKPLLLVSQLGTLAGFILLWRAQSLAMVFAARIIDGLTAGNLSLAQAYIADVTKPEERARSFAVIGIAFGLGFLVGPAVSGYLANLDVAYPMFMAQALSATSVLATFFLLPWRDPRKLAPSDPAAPLPGGKRLALVDWGSYVAYFRRPELAPLLWQFFAFAFAFAAFTGGFALFAERQLTWSGVRFGPKQVGYAFAWAGFLGILLQGGLIGRLVKRFGEPRLIGFAFASATAGYLLLGGVTTVLPLLGVTVFSSVGQGLLRPLLTSQITQHTDKREQGTVLGLTQSMMSVAQIIAPALGGLLIEHDQLFAWAAFASLATLVGLWLHRRAAGRAVAASNA